MGIKLSPLAVTAAFSVVIFLVAIGWQATRSMEITNTGVFAAPGTVRAVQNQENRGIGAELNAGLADGSTTSSGPNDFSNVQGDVFGELFGTYVALKTSGAYTEEKGADVANRIAEATIAPVSYAEFTASDIKTDADVSYDRMLSYRSDLQKALAPLLLNSESELGIFNRYVQTRDKHNLTVLGEVAGRYRETVTLLSAMTVPEDAREYHLDIMNALLHFATTLDALIKNADEPMAVLALLGTYNTAELNVYTSFNSLASYEKRKIP